jgi:aconitase B
MRTVAPEALMLSLLFQFWICQSFCHASLRKKSDVANASVALFSFDITVGGVADAPATFLKSWKRW